jgi:hypothetical protein
MKQQAADRLSVQQQGAALREAEQLARRRAAAEAPLVLHQLEAEARRKVRIDIISPHSSSGGAFSDVTCVRACMPCVLGRWLA